MKKQNHEFEAVILNVVGCKAIVEVKDITHSKTPIEIIEMNVKEFYGIEVKKGQVLKFSIGGGEFKVKLKYLKED